MLGWVPKLENTKYEDTLKLTFSQEENANNILPTDFSSNIKSMISDFKIETINKDNYTYTIEYQN